MWQRTCETMNIASFASAISFDLFWVANLKLAHFVTVHVIGVGSADVGRNAAPDALLSLPPPSPPVTTCACCATQDCECGVPPHLSAKRSADIS